MKSFVLANRSKAAIVGVWLLLASTQALVMVPVGHNDTSRWNTVYALVHHGTYYIDQSPWPQTVDKYNIEKDGQTHWISSKPAFVATLAAPVYALAANIGLRLGSSPWQTKCAILLVLTLTNLLLFGIGVWQYQRFLQHFALAPLAHGIAMTVAMLGTYLTGYLYTLSNHVWAGWAMVMILEPLYRFVALKTVSWRDYVAVGFMGSFAVCCDLPAILFLILVATFVGLRSWSKFFFVFVPTALIPLAMFFTAEFLASGSPIPNQVRSMLFGKSMLSQADSSYRQLAQTVAIQNLNEPFYLRLFHMVLGHHGIFSLTPIFGLALWGMPSALRRPERVFIAGLAGVAIVTTLVFAYKTSNYGGFAQGMRWLFCLIPIWLFLLPYGLQICDLAQSRQRMTVILLLAISLYSALFCLPHPWSASWLHEGFRHWGWTHY